MRTYIHPDDERIGAFIRDSIRGGSIREAAEDLLAWFDENVGYSRLNAPFFPLQRSDLDVLAMRSGTCGDYSNLIVSVLLRLGYEAGYAYVHTDCYGDGQDHICAAVREGETWALLDATLPYRKWHGFPCPHRNYELLSPDGFEERMKREETYWTEKAEKRYGNALMAGLLYAPWIHERIVRETDDSVETLFYLLTHHVKTLRQDAAAVVSAFREQRDRFVGLDAAAQHHAHALAESADAHIVQLLLLHDSHLMP